MLFRSSFGKSGSVHALTLSQDLDSAAGLLAFTVGSGTFIHNRMPDIESGRFFYYPVPTFGYGLGFIHPIKIMLSYSNINLAGDFTINSGYHQLVVEKTASSVKSNVTIRTA